MKGKDILAALQEASPEDLELNVYIEGCDCTGLAKEVVKDLAIHHVVTDNTSDQVLLITRGDG